MTFFLRREHQKKSKLSCNYDRTMISFIYHLLSFQRSVPKILQGLNLFNSKWLNFKIVYVVNFQGFANIWKPYNTFRSRNLAKFSSHWYWCISPLPKYSTCQILLMWHVHRKSTENRNGISLSCLSCVPQTSFLFE